MLFGKLKSLLFYSSPILLSLLSFLSLQTLVFSLQAQSQERPKLIKKNSIFYLSSDGFLVQLDLSNLKDIQEIGKKPIGLRPWQGVHCQDYLYSTDFASDQLFAYNLRERVLQSKILPKEESGSSVILFNAKAEKERKKSQIQRFFNRIHRPKKKESKKLEAIREPLEVSKHNKRLGLSSLACSRDYIFVSASLKERIEVISRKSLKRVTSFKVPSNYHLAVSPNGELLALSSSYLDRVYLIGTGSLKERSELEVSGNPTKIVWLSNSRLAVLSREDEKIKVFNTENENLIKEFKFSEKINAMEKVPGSNLLVALSGEARKAFLLDAETFEIKDFKISSSLRFGDLIGFLDSGNLLIGSTRDGRILLIDLKSENFQTLAKIQANLPPLDFINKEESSYSLGNLNNLNNFKRFTKETSFSSRKNLGVKEKSRGNKLIFKKARKKTKSI